MQGRRTLKSSQSSALILTKSTSSSYDWESGRAPSAPRHASRRGPSEDQLSVWRSPAATYLRKELELWLPEVAELPKDRREAVHAVASFSMWNRLREFQGLSIKTSADIVTSLVNDLIASS